jgi:hypothetical protein
VWSDCRHVGNLLNTFVVLPECHSIVNPSSTIGRLIVNARQCKRGVGGTAPHESINARQYKRGLGAQPRMNLFLDVARLGCATSKNTKPYQRYNLRESQ